ncbi:hypothetical protein Tco_0117780 [Tanacetum coccineum]
MNVDDLLKLVPQLVTRIDSLETDLKQTKLTMGSDIVKLVRGLDFQEKVCTARDIPLDSVVVLRYEKRSKSDNKGNVPTEIELVLEQTQQGRSLQIRRILKDGHGGTWFQLTHRLIATCSYLTAKHKDIMKAQAHVSRLLLL